MKYILYSLTIAFIVVLFFSVSSIQVQARGVLEPRSEQDTQTVNENDQENEGYTTEDIKDMVEDEFGEDHPMVAVARCESSFRQYDNDEDVLRNPESDAIGIFQILEGLHEEPAEELGIDIFSAEGNIEYTRKLYDSFGLAPWSPSSLCWDDGSIDMTNSSNVELQQQEESTKVPVKVRSDGELEPLFNEGEETPENNQRQDSVDNPLITKKLVSGVTDPQVRDLQRLLNDIGYQLSSSGPGSKGQETDFFGAKTRSAVKEFQCDQGIVCSGGRYTTGYGLVDKETRQALNRAAEERDAGMYRIGDLRVRTKDFDTDNNEEAETSEGQNNNESTTSNSSSTKISRESLQEDLARAQELVSQLAAQINN